VKFRDGGIEFTRELARFGDDFRLLSRFARTFIDEAPLRIEAIRQGLVGRNDSAVLVAATSLADALRTLGATETAAIADEVAQCGHDREFIRAKFLLFALRRNIDELVSVMRTWPPVAAADAAQRARTLQSA